MADKDLLYTESHEWMDPEGDIRRMGITDHAQHMLGDIVYVELPEVGLTLAKGDEMVVVESPKAAADVYAPVSGEVVEVNTVLEIEPNTVNQSPYDNGWIVKIKPSNPDELSGLLNQADYLKTVEG